MAQTKQPKPVKREASAVDFIFQWLSYAFWGWLTVAVLWLIGITLSFLIQGTATGSVVPYSIAAIVVLLPFAFVVDLFYRRREPLKKAGVATALMVVHAVIFAVIAIGSLIGAVFLGLGMLLGDIDSGNSGETVALCVTLASAALFGALFLRVVTPFKSLRYARFYALGLLGLTIVLIIAAIAGPAARSFQLRNDKRIETSLYAVQDAINSYIDENEKSPASLSEVNFRSEGAKDLVEDKLVEYRLEEAKMTTTTKEYRYQLCVEYQEESRGEYNPYASYNEYEDNGTPSTSYIEYLSNSYHPSGDVCYKLKHSVLLER